MIKLNNPYAKLEGYNCFACAPDNHDGLKMTFYEDGEEVVSEWQPTKQFEGFYHVLHGGIQATIMDEIANWVVAIKTDTSGMTIEMTTQYHKPVMIEDGHPVTIRARLTEKNRKKAHIHAQIFNFAGDLCSEGKVVYYLFPPQVAAKKLYYPGRDAFFEK
ncbi:MAG TPA: PaaI family thioesterase [Salinivirga sp.]|uniref:PaaI family thioesterase n=1 Tax=Salinivirga sp. TaxID=1970192 RepID=UPI002B47BF0F|nr:PaaI family thioesterase [Salinivirga sp.]HKK58408.1 PaaI family thioesterase [Salinivirga sp.]